MDINTFAKHRLGDYAQVQGGYAFKSNDFSTVGVPVLKIKNVRIRTIDVNETSFVPVGIASDAQRYFLKNGDVVISMTGSGPSAPNSIVGRVARYTGCDNQYLINQRIGRFVNLNPQELDLRYLFIVLSQKAYQQKLVSIATGSGNQANISGKQIENLEIPMPSLSIQNSISEFLGAIDDKIELNKETNKTLEEITRTIFRDWFIEFNPVRYNAGEKSISENTSHQNLAHLFPKQFTEDGLPETWSLKSIYDFADVIYGAPFSSEQFRENNEGGLPLIRIRDLEDHNPKIFTNEIHPKGYKVQPGDIVVGMDGEFRIHFWRGPISWLNQRVCCFKPKSEISKVFIANSLRPFVEFLESSKVGTTVIHLGKGDIDTIKFIDPGQEILEKFKSLVEPLMEKSVENSLENSMLANLRDLLLPMLLSGEIKITEAEKRVGALL